MDVKSQLRSAVERAAERLGVPGLEVAIQETPAGKPGDYGTPAAFVLSKKLGQNPAAVAAQLQAALELPAGVARAEAVGPYLNFYLDRAAFVAGVLEERFEAEPGSEKVVIEHTSVNPNKELHVGHLRNVVLGDAMARIFRAAGHRVEVQNYIDDTGRQAAESLFARNHYAGENWREVFAMWSAERAAAGKPSRLDHWLGELYVRLNADPRKAELEPGILEIMHRLEAGELREDVELIVQAQLQTCFELGVSYDLLVWESDVVGSGFLAKALEILEASPYCSHPTEGKYAGAFVMDTSEFIPGLEDPTLVLQRSGGTATYTAKDIGLQFWKFGLFEGLGFREFAQQPSGQVLYTSHPQGQPDARFAHAAEVINVIDDRQSYPQAVVKAALAIAGHREQWARSFHLAYGTVKLEGQDMSGRKGITLSVDDVLAEAQSRAMAVLGERSLEDAASVARAVGYGALRLAMLKSEPKKQIDFRWETALSLQGDTAPYVQYAAVRARNIVRRAAEAGITAEGADLSQLGEFDFELAKVIARFPDALAGAVRDHSPHHVVQHALDLATAFNGWYNLKDEAGKPATRVIDAPAGLAQARVALVARMGVALERALEVLGIEVPAEM
ncbi:arginyl-tRNA synthetase [Deinobacterium chartae]|uniref:arginine--tRNA ligase n=1 Tax=Deinobacterium chartae TaxID=521158 RepID=A0A841HY90_9DEIO|nr:arginine--tRNA ligase [Deinobacterium chartae]MBB6096755.1 arginyl-tRNA synthetase [Deinobacterium chartae]